MQPCKFTFDDSPEFDGFAHGSTWNGFDNVAVTAAERERIRDWMYASAIDVLAVGDEVEDLMGINPCDPLGPQGQELYSLGWGYATQIVREREDKPLPDNAADILAERFVAVLRDWLTQTEWLDMCIRNEAEHNAHVCHTHDYCDANMAMDAAFREVARRAPDIDDDADVTLWNKAWEIAMPALGRK
jgi:hypothetical protein